MAKSGTTEQIIVNEIEMGEVRFNVLGQSPLIMNRYAQKAWQQLLLPKRRESRATLESKLKHDPVAEFRGALYRNRDDKSKALIHVPNGAFHKALAQAGVDMPGAAKAKLERLTSIADVNIDLFGVPRLHMSMVRNSDVGKTPDVRTRPVFMEWACEVSILYVRQLLSERTIAALMGAAGVIVGIGDWRPQKGGSYGRYKLVSYDDENFNRIVANQGRLAQQAAYDHPECYDQDTEELMAWYNAELIEREREASSSKDTPKKKPKAKQVIVENGHGDFLGTEVAN